MDFPQSVDFLLLALAHYSSVDETFDYSYLIAVCNPELRTLTTLAALAFKSRLRFAHQYYKSVASYFTIASFAFDNI